MAKRGKAILDTEEEPRLFADLQPIWKAWQILHDTRPIGMAPGGIPWSELSRYAEDHDRHGEDRMRFCRMLHRMDVVWLGEYAKKGGESSGNPGAGSRREGSDAGSAGGGSSARPDES